MTDHEKALMHGHARYFQQGFQAGRGLLYGPVMAPDGAFGVGILEVADQVEARRLGENDPSVRGGMKRWEIYPMRVADCRSKG